MGREPVPDLAEHRQHVVTLQPFDVDHLEAVEHGHVDHLAGRVPQRRQHRQRGLVQVDVLGDRGAELVQREPEPVLPRHLVLLEQPLGLQCGHQPVGGALAEPEPPGELGDAELLVGVREGPEHAGGVADRPQQRTRRLRHPRSLDRCPVPRDIVRGCDGRHLCFGHVAAAIRRGRARGSLDAGSAAHRLVRPSRPGHRARARRQEHQPRHPHHGRPPGPSGLRDHGSGLPPGVPRLRHRRHARGDHVRASTPTTRPCWPGSRARPGRRSSRPVCRRGSRTRSTRRTPPCPSARATTRSPWPSGRRPRARTSRTRASPASTTRTSGSAPPTEVQQHVLRCWASLYTDRAIAYRRQMAYAEDSAAMSVGIQQMVMPRTSGVAFTLNPLNGDRCQIAIDASWGLGEAVVSGSVTPDNYLVDKVVGEITSRTISPKAIEHVLVGDRVVEVEVDAGAPRRPLPERRRRSGPSRRWPAGPSGTTAAPRTWSGPSTRCCPRARTSCCSRPARRRSGAATDEATRRLVRRHLRLDRAQPAPPLGNAVRPPALSRSAAALRPNHRRTPMADRFPSPFEMPTPTGAEGWEELYGYSTVFSEDRRELEESMFWFMDGVHTPEVDPALGRHGPGLRDHRASASTPPATTSSRRRSASTSATSTATCTSRPSASPTPRRSRPGSRSSPNAPATTSPTGTALYDDWMDKIKGVIAELEAIELQAAPAPRGHGRAHRGPRHRQRAS